MTPILTWSNRALVDLRKVLVAIAIDHPRAAEQLGATVRATTELLTLSPRLGRRRPDLSRTARSLAEGNYLIIYELQPDTHTGPVEEIEIIRFVHGSRNLRRLAGQA